MCSACRAVRDAPPRAPLHPWEFPLNPWQRVHADFGECGGKKYLIIVDAHSKWIEAIMMRSTDSRSTIAAFRSVFASQGLPSRLVTDNGPPFFSLEFKEFCVKNCIQHVTSAPYRPQGNGAAENAVKTIKKCLKRALHEGEDVATALSKFLLQYRNCPHATTGVAPAVALMGRRLRSRLDALRPDVAAAVQRAQRRQQQHAPGSPRPALLPGDTVLARDYSARGGEVDGREASRTNRTSFVQKVDKDADVTFEDASEGEGDTAAADHNSPVCGSNGKQVTSPPPHQLLPSDMSARALRALNRAQRINKNNN
ncbi:unnamed protein product [Plutella xylostella]|uniref:(diamondback moth) hypothetical protein n=1 Tax=Plutella xylostella TaxID=51655 RepID=A0A8S4G6D5_PLUXY|nr:unnamed protein product [Plutella xylostella]